MSGTGNVKMPCGRRYYCGRQDCPHAAQCAEISSGAVTAVPKDQWRAAKEPLSTRAADVVYVYDGSLAGFYCCVYESVYGKEMPAGIWPEDKMEPTLYDQRWIDTQAERAQRVEQSIQNKISPRALELVHGVFLSCLAEKEMALLRFLLLGYANKSHTPWMFAHPDVKTVLAAEKHKNGEEHLLKGFIRFSDYGGVLAATITPKNFVLPGLLPHFVGRYSQEDFLIFDKTHKAALVYEKGKASIIPVENMEFPQADEKEEQYRSLWKQFYNTISITARENPTCRRSHMPMRYWENMLEVADLLHK